MNENPITKEQNDILRHIQFTVCANSGAWGISTLKITGLEYHGDPKQFQQDIMQKVLMMGYTSILNYNDELGLLMCCYNTHKELFEEILRHVRRQHIFRTAAEAIKELKAAKTEKEQYQAWQSAKEAGVELKFNEYIGEWMYGCTSEDGIVDSCREEGRWLYTVKTVLQMAGFDPEERQKTRRVCENLGMYRA